MGVMFTNLANGANELGHHLVGIDVYIFMEIIEHARMSDFFGKKQITMWNEIIKNSDQCGK